MMDKTVRVKGRDLDVNFEVEDITLGKSGIGWYEFWGARCYDAGVTYVDDFTVTAITVYSERRDTYVAPSPRLLTAITEAIYDDEGIREDLLERAEVEAEAARDAYHEAKLDPMRGC
jgi:hypothetical protein